MPTLTRYGDCLAQNMRLLLPSLQFWEGIRSGVKVCDLPQSDQASQASLNIQLDTTAGGVLPAGPLSSVVVVGDAMSPADLVGDKRLCRQAEELVKGAKVSQEREGGLSSASPSLSTHSGLSLYS